MDRTEWPTTDKLQALREEGIAPYSRFTTACAIALAVCFSAFFLQEKWAEFTTLFSQQLMQGELLKGVVWTAPEAEDTRRLLKLVMQLFAVPALAAVVAACGIGAPAV